MFSLWKKSHRQPRTEVLKDTDFSSECNAKIIKQKCIRCKGDRPEEMLYCVRLKEVANTFLASRRPSMDSGRSSCREVSSSLLAHSLYILNGS